MAKTLEITSPNQACTSYNKEITNLVSDNEISIGKNDDQNFSLTGENQENNAEESTSEKEDAYRAPISSRRRNRSRNTVRNLVTYFENYL